jgi:hypothetical protein
MVEGLGRVVENADAGAVSDRLLDDRLHILTLEIGPMEQIVRIGHIGVMVFAVMELQRLSTDDRIKGILGIGKFGKRKGHLDSPPGCDEIADNRTDSA